MQPVSSKQQFENVPMCKWIISLAVLQSNNPSCYLFFLLPQSGFGIVELSIR